MLQEGGEELVIENVDILENKEDQVRLVDLFGQEKTIRARVKVLSLVEHKIILEPI